MERNLNKYSLTTEDKVLRLASAKATYPESDLSECTLPPV
jgi:hypothetical protein